MFYGPVDNGQICRDVTLFLNYPRLYTLKYPV